MFSGMQKNLIICFLLAFIFGQCNINFNGDVNAKINSTHVTNTPTTTTSFTIGGTVTGLIGTNLVLQNLGIDNLSITTDGTFTFDSALADSTPYDVTVLVQPTTPAQTCTITNGAGILSSANVSDILVNCVTNSYPITGSVTGLVGSGLSLQNNGVETINIPTDGTYSFPSLISDLSSYNVTISSQPVNPNQYCIISGGSGVISGAAPSPFAINCTTNTFTITFDSNGGTGSMPVQVMTTIAANLNSNSFTKLGCLFLGWSSTPNGSIEYTDMSLFPGSTNITLYAIWSAYNEDYATFIFSYISISDTYKVVGLTSYGATKVSLTIPSVFFYDGKNVTEIAEYFAINGGTRDYNIYPLHTIIVSNGIQTIGFYAFHHTSMSDLIDIFIPASVTTIGEYACGNSANRTIYVNQPNAPVGWDINWNAYNEPVIWNYVF